MTADTLIDFAKDGDSRSVRRLLEQGINPDMEDRYGETALTWAAHMGHTAVVKDLLAAGAERDKKGGLFHASPLLLASRGGHRGVVALLAVLSDVNFQDGFGATALMLAVERYEPVIKPQRKVLAIIKTLIEQGADLDVQDMNGDTALHWAVRWHNHEAVKLLLSAHAHPGIRNHRDQTPETIADNRGASDLVRLFHLTELPRQE